MRRRMTAIVLAAAALVAAGLLGVSTGGGRETGVQAQLADGTPTVFVCLPLMRLDPTPTPTAVPQCELYIGNDTGGQLCYEVYGTGIGRKCFSGGKHYYGTFAAGSYTYRVEARCGSLTLVQPYPPGIWTETYQCP